MTKAQEILARTEKLLDSMNRVVENKETVQRKKREKKVETQSGKGYIYVYDDDGKPILKGRYLLEKRLGRKLKEFEVVIYKDKNRKNCVEKNLELGVKNLDTVAGKSNVLIAAL